MKSVWISFVLAFGVSGAAHAEWELASEGEPGRFYFDPQTIKFLSPNERRVWTLIDVAKPFPDGTRSLKDLMLYDCKNDSERHLANISTDGPMGQGRVVESNNNLPGKLEALAPDTTGWRLLKAVCASNGAPSGQWVEISESDDVVFYFDPATIRKDGSFLRVWELQNLKKPGGEGEKSRQVLREYDCNNERSRNIFLSAQSEPMGKGIALLSGDLPNPKWKDIKPGSARSIKIKQLCNK